MPTQTPRRPHAATLFPLLIALLGLPALLTAQEASPLVGNLLRQQDSDKDGIITEAEAQGRLKQNFQATDTNGDGRLSKDELEALAKRVRGMAQRTNRRPRQSVAPLPEGIELEEDLAYREGNPAWKMDLVKPIEDSDQPRPAIVFVHGGGWRSGDKGGGIWRSLPIEFAQRGYVCISINYRLSQEAPFPACLEDCQCAVRWLRANADELGIDPQRIGAFGNSAGAHLVSLLGLTGREPQSDSDQPFSGHASVVNAVVPCATPADFLVWAKDNLGQPKRLLAGDSATLTERARQASPVTHAHADAPPFLIFHGTADRTVPVDQGRRLHEALTKAGADNVTYKEFENAGHGVFREHEDQTLPMTIEFFQKHLRPAPTPEAKSK